MKNYKWITGIFCAIALTLSPAAFAEDENQWTLSLGGSGATVTTDNGATGFGADLSIGHTGKLLLPIEAGVRQGIAYNSSDVVLNTKVYADFTLLSVKAFDVFAGGNIGAYYGDTPVLWRIAPEAGIRLWLKDDVGILARAEAPFDLEGWKYQDNIRYFLGFQVKF